MFISILTVLLVIVEALSCLLLIGVILLQKTKGQGLGMTFGAGVGETLFGAQVGNVLTRTTVILAGVFLLNTTFLAMLLPKQARSVTRFTPAAAPASHPAGTAPSPSAPSPQDMPEAPAAPVPPQPPSAESSAVPLPSVPITIPSPGQTPVSTPAPAPEPAPAK